MGGYAKKRLPCFLRPAMLFKEEKTMKILIIAPHLDDEVLGCGGTIVKHSKRGDEVYLCIVTKAYTPDWSEEYLEKRKKELEATNGILGIKKTYSLGFPTVKLDTISQKELIRAIVEVINKVGPEVVYFPHGGDVNKDHRLVFEATLVATRPAVDSSIKKLLCYETLSETEWGRGFSDFIPNLYEDIDKEFETKLKAMNVYQSEVREFPHPRSLKGISVLAEKRGSEAGLLKAEAFVLIRQILN